MLFSKCYFLVCLLIVPVTCVLASISEQENKLTQGNDVSDQLQAEESLHFRQSNAISIGPEIYRTNRDRAGGTKQKGNFIGFKATYDRVKRYHFYIGARLFYGAGVLNGHSGDKDRIRSKLTERLIEANIGYTFQSKCFPHASFTPFVGYGYFKEVNHFSPPSILQIKFTTQFRYFSFGFLSSIYVHPCFTIGINGRFKWPWQTRCKVTDDPDFNTIHQLVEDEMHYRIELPLTYFGKYLCDHFEMALIPFFEHRLYGARQNYPFDFFKTTFTLYGCNLQLIYRF